MISEAKPASGVPSETQAFISKLITLFFEDLRDEFDAQVSLIPQNFRQQFLKMIIDKAVAENPDEAMILVRHLGHLPAYQHLFINLPARYGQGIFFVNQSFLKTRVSLSFVEHPLWVKRPIDYTVLVVDQTGREAYKKLGTLRPMETHNFNLDQMLAGMPHVTHGKLLLLTSEINLASLRIYAYWYNENSVTSTHEKGAYVNSSGLIIYPTIIVDDAHDTYIAISNLTDHVADMGFLIKNYWNEELEDQIKFSFNPNASLFVPLGNALPKLKAFLNGKPGSLYVSQTDKIGMHYYFIHNRRLNSWQAQHM